MRFLIIGAGAFFSPVLHLPVDLVFIVEAGTLGQHSNRNPDSRECGGRYFSTPPLPRNGGYGSSPALR
jgi:hypothetical protein